MPQASGSAVKRHNATHWGAVSAVVEDGRLVAVEPFAKDPHPSRMLASVAGAVHDRTRVAEPMVRAGYLEGGPGSGRRGAEPFVTVGWDCALDLVTAELKRIKRDFGNEASYAGCYGWASPGRFNHAPTLTHRFLNLFGGFTASVNTYSYAAAETIMPHILGDFLSILMRMTDWPVIADHTKLFVTFGGVSLKKTQIDSGGSAEHSTRDWLRTCREAGVEFVSIGPLKEDSADFFEAEWIAPRPGTDSAIMLGLAHTLVAEGLYDRAFLERYTVGFSRFLPYLMGVVDGQPKDAAWAAAIAGIDAETIISLAQRMAASRTMLNVSWSLQRCDHGEQSYWMATTLAAMLGQIGLLGGGIGYGYAAVGAVGQPNRKLAAPKLTAGANPTGRYIPVARIADMLFSPGAAFDYNGQRMTYPDIKMIYWCGGNPFHHHQDLNRLVEAWQKPDSIIVHEPWWTPLARHADIVLPATMTFERNDIGGTTRDRYVLAMYQAIEPVGAARNDFDIFASLADRLGLREAFTEGRSEMEWLRHLYDGARQSAAQHEVEMPGFEEFWQRGYFVSPPPAEPYVFLEAFRDDPVAAPLPTPSGKIEIFSETVDSFGYDDCPGHPVWLEPVEWLGAEKAKVYPLHLISNQPRTRLHGQMDNGRLSRESKIKGREPAWLNPADAQARGIADGDIVRLFNDRGACLAGAVVSESVQPRVVQLATGAWYDPVDPGVPGSLCKHGNPNVLTPDKGSSRLGQGPIAHSCLVEVERHDGRLPEITAFTPPTVEPARTN